MNLVYNHSDVSEHCKKNFSVFIPLAMRAGIVFEHVVLALQLCFLTRTLFKELE